MRSVDVLFWDVAAFEPSRHTGCIQQCILPGDSGPCSNHPIWVISQATTGPLQIEAQKGKLIPCIEHSEIAFRCAKCPSKACLNTSGSLFCFSNKAPKHVLWA
jgi:hypothetical protein